MDYAGLKTEIALPAHNGQTDAQIAAALNAQVMTLTPSPMTLTGAQIYNAISPAEFTTRSAAQQQTIRDIISAAGNGIDVSAGSNARTAWLSVFALGTASTTAILALLTVTTTRTEQLGWPHNGLNDQEIAAARKWAP